jgi:DNA-directed RNA polymerase subunit H (RpoH/RPB5)
MRKTRSHKKLRKVLNQPEEEQLLEKIKLLSNQLPKEVRKNLLYQSHIPASLRL